MTDMTDFLKDTTDWAINLKKKSDIRREIK